MKAFEGPSPAQGPDADPFLYLLPILQGGRTLISLISSTGSGEERGEDRVWAVPHTRNPEERRLHKGRQGE